MHKRKWEIESLSPKISFKAAARIALSKRAINLKSYIKKYIKNETPANLHKVRIALRRLRYSMELFLSCFERKEFLIFYKAVSQLQDLTGKIRDTDVLVSSLKSIAVLKDLPAREEMVQRVSSDNLQRREEMNRSLLNFLKSEEFNHFLKILKR